MGPQISFIKDAAARCTDMLSAAGYVFQSTDEQDVIRNYTSIRHRRIRPRARIVHKASYTIPLHVAEGERQLLAKTAAGGDLWPHQSRKISNIAAEDGMLNDYGIQHFHLGTSPDPKHPHLIQGTKELLFAVLTEDEFYALGVFDHSAWSKQALLGIIHENWPQLIAPYAFQNGPHMKVLELRHNYTDDEAAKLRSAGVNVLQQRSDGTIHAGMGGGITSNGKSIVATRDAIKLVALLKDLQSDVLKTLETKIPAAGLPGNTAICLKWRNNAPFVVTDPPAFEIDLTGILDIPAL